MSSQQPSIEDAWRAALSIVSATGDYVTAYNVFTKIEQQIKPWRTKRAFTGFLQTLRKQAILFDVKLPDRRRKPQEDNNAEAQISLSPMERPRV